MIITLEQPRVNVVDADTLKPGLLEGKAKRINLSKDKKKRSGKDLSKKQHKTKVILPAFANVEMNNTWLKIKDAVNDQRVKHINEIDELRTGVRALRNLQQEHHDTMEALVKELEKDVRILQANAKKDHNILRSTVITSLKKIGRKDLTSKIINK
jgi:hypothetical protein